MASSRNGDKSSTGVSIDMVNSRAVAAILIAAALTSGCAAIEESIAPPAVSLTEIELEEIGFSEQTFTLSFDVSNPNPFPLPVSSINYGVVLDGYRFASGATQCDILVAAESDSEVIISVDLDLLNTAPALLSVVRDSARGKIPYAIEGRIGVDIPAVRPVKFEHAGEIQMTAVFD